MQYLLGGLRIELNSYLSNCKPGADISVLLEFSLSPLDKGESVSQYVARSLDIISRSGVPYRLNPMGTVLEGEWNQVISVVTQCYQRMAEDCSRISCTIKIDARQGKDHRLTGKVARLEQILDKKLNR
jgi:uncharacterized protein (TIGR00106 family)